MKRPDVARAHGGSPPTPNQPAPSARTALPERIRPMLATAGALPVRDEGWGYEFKWDGVRAVTYVEAGVVRALSRNDRDVTASYPELEALTDALGSRVAVLDGELVALDSSGTPSFEALQPRLHVTGARRVQRLAERTPVTYLVFDVLHLDSRSTLSLPYIERRRLLDSIPGAGGGWYVPPWFCGEGLEVLQTSIGRGLEGVVAKRLDSIYEPGQRSRAWIKVKHLRSQEVAIVGWANGRGRRAASIGALLLAVPGPDGLRYAGRVGTGFSEPALRSLAAQLEALRRTGSPLAHRMADPLTAGVHWVQPTLVGEVAFSGWTAEGRLRHPRWRGLRPDKEVGDIIVEP